MFEYLKGIRSGLHLWVLIIFLFLSCAVPMGIHSSKPFKLLLNFDDLDRSGRWMVVNDGVMGGVSSSNLNLHSEGHLVFKGEVSMEYGGGFASVRTDYENWKIGKFEGFILKVRGDGKTYQFRCRLGNSFDGVAYRHYFQANDENWKEILLPFNEFVPTYRGKILKDSAPMDPESIRHLGLMISDKQSGNFRLEIAWIGVY